MLIFNCTEVVRFYYMDTSAQRSTFTLLRPKSQTFNFYSCTLPPPYEVLVLLVCPCLSPTAFRPPRRERVQPCLHGPEIVAREEARLHPLFLVGRADELRTYRVPSRGSCKIISSYGRLPLFQLLSGLSEAHLPAQLFSTHAPKSIWYRAY